VTNTLQQTKESVLSIIRKNQDKITTLGVKRIGLFGSFVRGEQNSESDVDLLIEFRCGQKTFDNFMQLSFLLEELLSRRVELVTPESLSPYIRPYIIKEVEYVSFIS
jgi:predicted nucleotidyltransferase